MKHIYSCWATRLRWSLLVLLILGLVPAAAQAQTHTWNPVTVLGGSPRNGEPTAIPCASVANAAGDVYVAGQFSGTISFGSTTLTSQGAGSDASDIFIAKWSRTTNSYVWAQRMGSTTNDIISHISLGRDGVYVQGFCGAGAVLGSTTLAEAGLFVARFTETSTGATVDWAQKLPMQNVASMAVSGANVYMVGYFNGTVSFAGQTLTSGGSGSGYLLRLTDTGTAATPVWIRSLGYNAKGVAATGNSVYASGYFTGQATFGAATLTSNGNYNGYVVKLDDSGTSPSIIWAQQMGGPNIAYANTLAVSGTSVYVAGEFQTSGRFGNTTLTGTNYDRTSGFITKLTDAGSSSNFVWAIPISNGYRDAVRYITVRGAAVYTLGGSGMGGLSIERYTDTGTGAPRVWSEFISNNSATPTATLAVNSYGQLYVGGFVYTSAQIGPVLLGMPAYPTYSQLGFWASIQDNTVLASTAASSAATLAVYPNPARTTVHVPGATATTTLTLTDAVGRMVRTATGPVLSVQAVAPGFYVLRAATPGQPVRTAKLKVE